MHEGSNHTASSKVLQAKPFDGVHLTISTIYGHITLDSTPPGPLMGSI